MSERTLLAIRIAGLCLSVIGIIASLAAICLLARGCMP